MFRKKWVLGTENLYRRPQAPDAAKAFYQEHNLQMRKEKTNNTKICYNREQQRRLYSCSGLLVHISPAWAVHAFCQHFPALPSALPCHSLPPVQPGAPTQLWQWPSLTNPLQNPFWAPQPDLIVSLNLSCDLFLLWCPFCSAGALSLQQLCSIIFIAPQFLSTLVLGTFFPLNSCTWAPAVGLPASPISSEIALSCHWKILW